MLNNVVLSWLDLETYSGVGVEFWWVRAIVGVLKGGFRQKDQCNDCFSIKISDLEGS